jgi:asparagine synthase (glutamine-hydrolysing)
VCGICGNTDDPSGTSVRAINGAMVHRGPDDEGVYVDASSGVALGVRRLSIIDIERGHQPLSDESGSVWASLNGEIYNHSSLREHLRGRGHTFASQSDTEVLVHLWQEYGPDMVHALEGMFAFAVWDERKRRLLVARDRFGEKPLYYMERAGQLIFASELTALLAGTPIPAELDSSVVDSYFVHGYVTGPNAIVQGVHRLPPGHLIEWQPGAGMSTRCYWQPPEPTPELREPLDELVAEAGRLLRESVRSRLIADVPVGVFLSGGIDSALIAAIAAQESSGPIKTFTIDYDVGGVGEARAAGKAASRLGASHREVLLRSEAVSRDIPAVLARLDEPHADQALVAMHALARIAREEVKVVIAGEGADELFGGYPRYRWIARGNELRNRLPEGALAAANSALRSMPATYRSRQLGNLLAGGDTLERNLDWMTGHRRILRTQVYGPRMLDVASDTNLNGSLNEASVSELMQSLMRADQMQWLPDDVLSKADRAGMLASLEVRTPYLHRELAEFAASVAGSVHIRGGGKLLLRRLLAETAPTASRWRAKRAFSVPATEWLRGPLAPTLWEQIRSGRAFEEGWFDRDRVALMARQHIGRKRDWTNALWPVMAFGLWLDRVRETRPSSVDEQLPLTHAT